MDTRKSSDGTLMPMSAGMAAGRWSAPHNCLASCEIGAANIHPCSACSHKQLFFHSVAARRADLTPENKRGCCIGCLLVGSDPSNWKGRAILPPCLTAAPGEQPKRLPAPMPMWNYPIPGQVVRGNPPRRRAASPRAGGYNSFSPPAAAR